MGIVRSYVPLSAIATPSDESDDLAFLLGKESVQCSSTFAVGTFRETSPVMGFTKRYGRRCDPPHEALLWISSTF
jgi:hypothetical protein